MAFVFIWHSITYIYVYIEIYSKLYVEYVTLALAVIRDMHTHFVRIFFPFAFFLTTISNCSLVHEFTMRRVTGYVRNSTYNFFYRFVFNVLRVQLTFLVRPVQYIYRDTKYHRATAAFIFYDICYCISQRRQSKKLMLAKLEFHPNYSIASFGQFNVKDIRTFINHRRV